jgi:sporulation protein YlmC with PRC-barrel domain
MPTGTSVVFIMTAPGRPGMPDVLARNLLDKAVMGSDGTELGTLSTMTVDTETGRLHDLVIAPRNDTTEQPDLDRDDEGRYTVPIGNVQAVKDHIVVGR